MANDKPASSGAQSDDDDDDYGTQPTLDLSAQPTVELTLDDGSAASAAASPGSSDVTAKPKKRRRALWWTLSGVVVFLLVVGVVLVETVGRAIATDLVRDKIVASLGLDSSDGVAVDLGSGSLLIQAVTGGLDVVTIDIDRFEVNGLTSSARVVATEVPLDSSKPIDTLTIDVGVPGDQLDKLAGNLSGLDLDSITLEGSAIRVSTVFELLFIKIPVAVDLLPVAAGDAIAFEPQSVLLGDEEISVVDLRNNQLFSGLAGSLLDSREFCVATSLPTAVTIDNVEIDGDELMIQLSANGIALDDEAWEQYGTCPEQ
ncbi:LmeA family phospholipid-binding protein [Salinibacterium sp. M195]|uniref:LmeA family phospholipid-binding protein n=1 Tax=Salinibacterium sp. M195 TaxID=2583374 RepID=UPI001C624888|nr:LmeA family phospholipid-binding protein [Salinibacterium sp. M195]QYH36565.1 DUF2993 domain-containing protein [Salinibacterium sp. M195]